MSQTKAQLLDTLVASLLPASDSSVDIGSNAVRFANIYGDTLYGNGANLTGINTDLVSDTSPQLGGNLDTNSNNIDFGDSSSGTVNRLRFGASTDLEIFHNGSHNHIDCHTTGQDLFIRPTRDVYFQDYVSDDKLIKMVKDGAVELYYDNSKKAETYSAGLSVTGTLTVGTGNITIQDAGQLKLGTGDDFKIYHDGVNSLTFFDATVGGVRFRTDIGNSARSNIILGAGVDLYYDNSKKFETTSVGAKVTGRLGVDKAPTTKLNAELSVFAATGNDDASDWGANGIFQLDHSGTSAANNEVLLLGAVSGGVGQIASGFGFGRESTSNWGTYLSFKTHSTSTSNIDELIERWRITSAGHFENNSDSVRIKLGASDDLQIYHDGNGTYLDNSSGNLECRTDEFRVKSLSGSNEAMIQASYNGNVQLWHDNTKRLETSANGVTVTGSVSCDGLTVSDNEVIALGNSSDLKLYHDSGNNYVGSPNNQSLVFFTNNSSRWLINGSGHFLPIADNAYDIGGTSNRIRNLYTADLQLSNEGSQNDVDATWGNYTIQEGHEDLFLINNRTGKKFKFNLTEVA